MPIVHLHDRAVVVVEGEDALSFLQNILTCDLNAIPESSVRPGALLSPQGKVLVDFLVWKGGPDLFLFDCAARLSDEFVRRLTLYRLRARAAISKREQPVVSVSWGADPAASYGPADLRDWRFREDVAVFRRYEAPFPAADAQEEAWHALRIDHGVAESGTDFAPGDAFPHDLLYDENDGVGFRKGCYVGQEVVSRMQHRGTARRRVMVASGNLPDPGTPILAGGRAVGSLGTVAGGKGLAIVRIDRVGEAMHAGQAITAGEATIDLAIPRGARYRLPQPDPLAPEDAG